ncbi:MAG: hypothetical protein RL657_295 [Pseudomonadota bacterium]|jgi:hypothetical protein
MLRRITTIYHDMKLFFMGSFVFKGLAPRLLSRSKHEPTPMALMKPKEKNNIPL